MNLIINETIIQITEFEDCSRHRLAKQECVRNYLRLGSCREEYFYKPLQKIFSKVIVYDYIKRTTEIGVKGINEEIIDIVRQEHPKYVFWYPTRYEFRESTFDAIRKEGSIVVAWFGDDEFSFDNYSKWWIPYLDYVVTNDIEAVPKYMELGARVTQAISCTGNPIACDWAKIKEKYDVSFVGVYKAEREQYVNELKNRNIPVHLFGKGWGGFVPFEEMIDIYHSSKINLNFSRASNTNRMGIKGRLFEVCLAGGFLLTEYVPGIEKYYEIDKEIVCFENAEEMIDKVTYYLNHDEERRAIAQAGWKRATAEYSSFQILSRIFSDIEADIAAKGKRNTSHPKELKMPRWVRKRFSAYYLNWLKAFSLENYKDLSKDAFALSISYNPFNIWAWCYYLASFLPYPVRLGAYKFGRLLYHSFRRLYLWVRHPASSLVCYII